MAAWPGIYARSSSSGPDRDYYSVLRTSSVPAVIFEGSYVSNPTEARLLATSAAFRQQLADSVADGVIAWVQAHAPASHDPGPPPSPPVGTAETTELVAIPANVRGVAPDWSKAVLTWSPAQNPLGADGARLFRDGQLIADLAPGTTSFTDTWVRPGTSYSYELRSTLPKVAGQNIVLQSDPVALRVVVPLRRTTVVLDPGHGGKDSGAAGSF